MEWLIPPELTELQRTVAHFVRRYLHPHERAVEIADHVDPDLMRELKRQAVALGLFAFNMPEEVGGPGLPYLAQVIVREQLGHVSMALSEAVGRPAKILLDCQGDQRDRYLLPAVRGEQVIAFGLTEPNAGSDATRISSSAARTAGGWVLNGRKHYISHADIADSIIVFAVTDAVKRHKGGITAFFVDRGTPGLEIRRQQKMGWRGYGLAEMTFDDCFVPDANVLGDVGDGFKLAMKNITEARLGVAAHCVGMGQRLLDLTIAHLKNRQLFGNALGEFQGVQWMLADAAVALESARLLTYQTAMLIDNGAKDVRGQVSMAKLAATEMAAKMADIALQLQGGGGYMSETAVEMYYRDVRAFRLGEGASEIHRNQIARSLMA
jgi:acyl-CoA dehydrogenase